MIEFPFRIAGIPCLIAVLHYSPGTPDVVYAPNGDPGWEGDPAEIEVEIRDRKGYRAEWLAKKITTEEEIEIYNLAAKAYKAECEEALCP